VGPGSPGSSRIDVLQQRDDRALIELVEPYEAEVAAARPQLAQAALIPVRNRGSLFDDGRIQRDVVLLQGQADDGPLHPLARLYLVLKAPIADEVHAHAGPAGRRTGIEPSIEARNRLTDKGIECLQVAFSCRIGVKVFIKRMSLHLEHAPNVTPRTVPVGTAFVRVREPSHCSREGQV
jgi:hypothetical protein